MILTTLLLRWNRSKNDPSFEKMLTGFCFGGTGAFVAVEARDMGEDTGVVGAGELVPDDTDIWNNAEYAVT